MNNIKYKLLVRCITYNHSQFITDAMDGFVMQKTNFPYLCCIIDDASTDGEQDVIKTYLEKNFTVISITENDDYVSYEAKHLENANCFFLVYLLKYNHYSIHKSKDGYYPDLKEIPYCAMCEGDDYWIDDCKLQKQFDYMESHPQCSMCFTNAVVTCDVPGLEATVHLYDHLEERDYTGFEILKKWSVPTASVFARTSVPPRPRDSRFVFGDIVSFLQLARYGSVHCINSKTVTYRRNSGGLSVKRIAFEKMLGHYDALLEHFGDQYRGIVDELKAKALIVGFLSGHLKADSWRALSSAIKNPRILLNFIRMFFPIFLKSLR